MEHTQTHTSSETAKRPPLWKQLMGAGVGVVVSLTLYHAYLGIRSAAASLLPSGHETQVTESITEGQTFSAPGVAPKKRIQALR
jgi:hypothetical protein